MINLNKICNPYTIVPKGKELNDLDYLNDLLITSKSMLIKYANALTDISNNDLYKSFKKLFDEESIIERDILDLMFQKGWYYFEEVDLGRIKETYHKFNNLEKEL